MRELFWTALPQYLAIGMSAEEFWHGHLRLCPAYREAHRIKRSNQDFDDWRAGVYVFQALLSAAPAFREFSPGVEHAYPSHPLFSDMGISEHSSEQAEKAHMERIKANVVAFAAAFNKRFEQGE